MACSPCPSSPSPGISVSACRPSYLFGDNSALNTLDQPKPPFLWVNLTFHCDLACRTVTWKWPSIFEIRNTVFFFVFFFFLHWHVKGFTSKCAVFKIDVLYDGEIVCLQAWVTFNWNLFETAAVKTVASQKCCFQSWGQPVKVMEQKAACRQEWKRNALYCMTVESCIQLRLF